MTITTQSGQPVTLLMTALEDGAWPFAWCRQNGEYHTYSLDCLQGETIEERNLLHDLRNPGKEECWTAIGPTPGNLVVAHSSHYANAPLVIYDAGTKRMVGEVYNDESPDHLRQLADAKLFANAFPLLKLALHIIAMKGDVHLDGHPEWHEIVAEAEACLEKAL